jgi:hypothetical protein
MFILGCKVTKKIELMVIIIKYFVSLQKISDKNLVDNEKNTTFVPLKL